jgi:hypothetical protein
MVCTDVTARPGNATAGSNENVCVTALHTAHAMAKANARCSGIGSHAFGLIRTPLSCTTGHYH